MRNFAAIVLVLMAAPSWGDELRAGPFAIYYSIEDKAYAEEALETLEAFEAELPSALEVGAAPVYVYVAANPYAFLEYAGPMASGNVAGVALPHEGIIVVKSPRILRDPGQFKSTVRHELVHVVLERNVSVDNMPRWLNEGLAMHLAGERRWDSSMTVGQMYIQNRIMDMRGLEHALLEPGREMAFGDAYAQSLSMTRFLISRLGEDRFWEMVDDLDAAAFREAMKAHAAMTPWELWEAWRRSLWRVALISSIVSGFTIFQVMAVLTVLAYLRRRRRGQELLREWDQEDREGYIEPDASDESDYDVDEDDEEYR